MIDTQTVFDLLPAVYRLRDAEHGGPLEALVSILAEQADVVDLDIELLYDNWFVETCDPWLIPYLGDLLAVRPVYPIAGAVSRRAYVANTIRYRRRKGTVSVLERLAADVTGWPAKAVEFFQLLETTQHVNHVRLQSLRTPDLRDADGLELLGGPFERAAHTAEVRRIATRHGRYDIPNVGLFVWRLGSYPLGLDDVDDGTTPTTRATARQLGDLYTFGPLGLDAPLFHDPSRIREETARVEEEDVPDVLRRRALFDELEGLRRAAVGWPASRPRFFTQRRHAVRVWTQATSGGPFAEIPPERMLVADLSLGQLPPTSKSYPRLQGGPPVSRPIDAAIDPRLGRLTFPSGVTPNAVEVAYAYGFPADVGGGPYERRTELLPAFVDVKRPPDVVLGVGRDIALAPGQNFANLTLAVQEWNTAIYCFRRSVLAPALRRVTPDNVQGEYYLTDVIAVLRQAGHVVDAIEVDDPMEVVQVNDRAQLATAEAELRARINDRWMRAGVTMVDPSHTYIDTSVELELDVRLLPGTILQGHTVVHRGAVIGPDVQLVDTVVGEDAVIRQTVAFEAEIGDRVTCGPYVSLRPGTRVGDGAHLGTYVEVKNSDIGAGAKVPHLSYVGDADVGERTNLGAGNITANYDGRRKHRTRIGKDVHSGSNTVFVAPVEVGDGAYTGAGAVVNRDVPPGAMAKGVPAKIEEEWASKRDNDDSGDDAAKSGNAKSGNAKSGNVGGA